MNNFDQVKWDEFKAFVDSRLLSIQFRETDNHYLMRAMDQWFGLECNLEKSVDTSDIAEFEADYKSIGNLSPKQSVRTQFERDDLILKIACAKATVDSNSEALIELKIPGVLADDDCRWIDGGKAFFDSPTAGDKVVEISIVDKDNVLGYGANTILKTYHDEECDAINQGWYIYPTRPLEIETLGYYGKIPAELYLVIKAKKANDITTGTFYVSIDWGVTG
jgi:hypothetical protein